MGNLTVDEVVALYAKYQSLHFWMFAGLIFTAIGFILGVVILMDYTDATDAQSDLKRPVGGFLLALGSAGLGVAFRCGYLIDAVLKPEVVGHIVAAGLEVNGVANDGVRGMLVLLMGLLK